MRTGIKLALSLVVALVAAYNIFAVFNTWRLPFDFAVVGPHRLVIGAAPAVPLPAPLRVGDVIDPAEQDFETRTALDVAYNGRTLPWNKTYDLAIRHDGVEYHAAMTTQPLPATRDLRVIQVCAVFLMFVLGPIGLLLLWRGRDRSAAALAAWCFCFIIGLMFNFVPFDGVSGVLLLEVSLVLFLLGRVSFYLMADFLVSPLMSKGLITYFRIGFVLVLLLGAIQAMGSAYEFAYSGDAELSLPRYSLFFSWIFIVPVALLVTGYRLAGEGDRVKLGWVAFAGVLLGVSVTITNAQPFGFIASYSISNLSFVLVALSLAYALLRLRVVSVAIVFDRAIVYGLVTTLVVGVIAAMNSVALRAALPQGAGILLQIVVPLALGIVLGKIRTYMDRLVERVFFRSKYLSEKALRTFARRAGHFEDTAVLFDSAAAELRRHTGTPALAFYSIGPRVCERIKESGQSVFPASLPQDDEALVALRAEHKSVDLASLSSTLGEDGCVLPMLVLGTLRGVLVLKNRPGEHFGSDERKLLAHVARDVGAAWRILRARENEALVDALAEGRLKTIKSARDRARALRVSWSGATG